MNSRLKYIVIGVIATLGLVVALGIGIGFVLGLLMVNSVGYYTPISQNTMHNPILSVGATVQYDENNIIYLKDIYPESVDIGIIQNGDLIAQTVCFENSVCSIGSISFQIDDIHIGEHSYMVYWWV